MDLSELMTADAHEEGAEVNIISPVTGKASDVFIKVLGPDSKAYRVESKRNLSKAVAEYRKLKGDSKDLDFDVMSDQEIEGEINKLVAVTVGWRGISDKGEPVVFSKEMCEKLYRSAPHIVIQVNNFLADYTNFTKG